MESKDLLEEQNYLIERGVRSLALIGQCKSDEEIMLKTITQLESVCSGRAIPFIIDRGDGIAEYGYASHPWVISLYKLALAANPEISKKQRGYIIGLLLGYSPEVISHFGEQSEYRIIKIGS